MSVRIMLQRSLPGTKKTIEGHIKRGEWIAQAIQSQFEIVQPHQWQVKHLRWILDRKLADKSLATKYDYWRTARVLASVLQRWPAWEPYLRGPWCKNGVGGRPAKLAHIIKVGYSAIYGDTK
jgi:hypothetical protein